MQDIFRMVKLQLLKLDLNDLGKIFVYYHVHSSFPFIPVKNSRSQMVEFTFYSEKKVKFSNFEKRENFTFYGNKV